MDSVFEYELCVCGFPYACEVVLMMLAEKTDKFLVGI